MQNEFNKTEELAKKALSNKRQMPVAQKNALRAKLESKFVNTQDMQKTKNSVKKAHVRDQKSSHKNKDGNIFDEVFKAFKHFFFGNEYRSLAIFGSASLGLVAIIALVAVLNIFNFPGGIIPGIGDKPTNEFNVGPVALSENGVSVESDFIITTDAKLIASELEKSLIVEPNIDFSVEKNDEGNLIIQPNEELLNDTEYSLTLPVGAKVGNFESDKDLKWSFRTEPKFSVISSTPNNNNYTVPTNTSIEINFNYKDIDLDSFKENFYIFPEVEIQSIKIINKSVVIKPKKNLEEGQTYRLLVEGGVKRENGEKLSQTFSNDFYTKRGSDEYYKYTPSLGFFTINYDLISPLNNKNKVVMYFNDPTGNYKEGKFTAYKIKPEFINEASIELTRLNRYSYDMRKVDSKYLEKIKETNFTATNNDNKAFSLGTVAPGSLVYVQATYKGVTTDAYYSKADYSAHMLNTQNNIVLGVFDNKGSVVSKGTAKIIHINNSNEYALKEVSLNNITEVSKDDIGNVLGVLYTVNDQDLLVVDTYDGYLGFDEYTSFSQNHALNPIGVYNYDDNLLSYFKFDKPIYKFGDNVEFKAFFRESDDFFDFSAYDVNALEYQVKMANTVIYQGKPSNKNDEFSYITGEFTIPTNFDPDSYTNTATVEVKYEGEVITTSQVSVFNYSRSRVSLDVTVDTNRIYHPGDKVKYSISGQDIAGNPLSGKDVELAVYISGGYRSFWQEDIYSIYGSSSDKVLLKKNVKLDQGGNANLEFTIPNDISTDNGEDVFSVNIDVNVNKSDSVSRTLVGTKGKTSLMAKTDKWQHDSGEKVVLNIKSIKPEDLSGVQTNDIKTTVTRHWSEKVENGTRYDSGLKQYVPNYDYISRETVVSTNTIATDNNGNAKLEYNFNDDGSYYVKFDWKENGKNISHEDYVFSVYKQDDNSYDYSNGIDIEISDRNPSVGDTLKVNISIDDRNVNNQDGYIILYKDKSYSVKKFNASTNNISKTFEVSKELTPNARLSVVIPLRFKDIKDNYNLPDDDQDLWDDSWYVYTTNYSMEIERPEVKLDVETQVSKKEYLPGEEVELSFKVVDSEGKPVSNANLNLRVFDKALLHVLDIDSYQPDIYKSIYNNYFPYSQTYTYPNNPLGPEGGDGGGDGDPGIRNNFQDVAAFPHDVVTDKDGNATVKFTAPDNITTWVVDVEAVTTDLKVGNTTKEFVVNKEVFVNYYFPATLHENDQIEIPIIAHNFADEVFKGELIVTASENITVGKYSKAITIRANSTKVKNIRFTVEKGSVSEGYIKVELKKNDDLIDGIEQSVQVYGLGYPNTDITKGKFDKDNKSVEFKLPEGSTQRSGSLQMTNNIFSLGFYPKSYEINSLPEIEASLLHNLTLLSNYEKYEDNISVSKTNLKEQIQLNLSSIGALQSKNGGFSWFGYDAVDVQASAVLAHIIGIAEENDIYASTNEKQALADFLANIVVKANGSFNDKTSIDTKVVAIWGLSSLDDSRALTYAQLIHKDIESVDTPLTIALLAEAFINVDSSGDAATVAMRLKDMANVESGYAYFEEPDKPFRIVSGNRFVTAKAYYVLAETGVDSELEELSLNWLVDNFTEVENNLEESFIYNILFSSADNLIVDNDTDITVILNDKEVYSGNLNSMGTSIYLPNLKESNKLTIGGLDEGDIYFRIQTSYLSKDQKNSNDKFKVTTQYIPLEGGVNTTNLPYNDYIRLRVSVTANEDVEGFSIKSYLPSGIRAVNWNPDSYYFGAFYDWYQSTKNEKNIVRYGQFFNDYVAFRGYGLKKGETLNFEMLLVTDNKGTYKTNGTFVYHNKIQEFSGYELGKTIIIK